MENVKELSNKKKFLPIILAAIAIIVIIVIIAFASSKKSAEPVTPKGETPTGMIDEVDPIEGSDLEAGEEMETINPVLVDAVETIKGGNLVSKEGKVITNEGVEIRTDVSAMDPEAPRQTMPLEKSEIPESVIKLDVSAAGFSPSEFTVKKGEVVTISLSSIDEWSHSIIFSDAKLSAVSIGVSTGEARGTTFPAPTEAGEYTFYCGVPGHAARGETGKMIVQ